MKYQVYQDGKPADCFGYPKVHRSWNKSSFETKREAEVYAFYWCYPISKDEAEKIAPEMELDKKYNYSICEFPVLMIIKEIERKGK